MAPRYKLQAKGTTLTGNRVTVDGIPHNKTVETVVGAISDATSVFTQVNNNVVVVKNGTIGTSGQFSGFVIGALSVHGKSVKNTVTVNGGSIGKNVYAGFSTNNEANDNTANITDGIIGADVIGGYSQSTTDGVMGNTVIVSGGSMRNIAGGSAIGPYTNGTASGRATNNTVIVSGGKISGKVTGGYARYNQANGNRVTITRGDIGGNVYGGATRGKAATNNTVRITGSATFDANNTTIYGGDYNYKNSDTISPIPDVKTGNTLEMATTGIAVKDIANFEILRFFVSENATKTGDTFLNLSSSSDTDISSTNIGICVANHVVSSKLRVDDELILITKQSGTLITDGTLSNNTTEMKGCGGYAFELKKTGSRLIAKVTGLPNYTVSFNMNGRGTAPSNQTVTKGNTANEPTAPTATGYTFDGWLADATMTTAYDFANLVNSDVTLYAKWTVNTNTVSFNMNGRGTAPSNQNVTTGNLATKPTVPALTGYTFGGWYTDANLKTKYDFDTEISSSFTLYAKWTINKYTISGTINGLDGGEIELKKAITGSPLVELLIVSKNGNFTFDTPVEHGKSYTVTLTNHPDKQSCKLENDTVNDIQQNETTLLVICRTLGPIFSDNFEQ